MYNRAIIGVADEKQVLIKALANAGKALGLNKGNYSA
jgi:hypothetical protein